jgi:transposase InsO family protein
MNTEKEDFVDDILKKSNVKSLQPIWQKVKKAGNPLNITQKELKTYLASFESVQVSKKNLINNSFVAHRPLQEFQIDIAYIKGCNYEDPKNKIVINQLKNKDKNRIYALTCIDVFTKFAWLVIMKNKDAQTTLTALKQIIAKMGKPESIYSDDGSEFKNKIVKDYCEENKIELIFNISHAPFIERWHRTLKERLVAYLRDAKTKTLTPDVLFDKTGIITEYNKQISHGTTEFTPAEAKKEENREQVRKNIKDNSTYTRRESIHVGDRVRALKKTKITQKGYLPKWHDEVHTVKAKEGKYFYLNGDPPRDKYLRHMLQKVTGEVKQFKKEAKDEGTKAKFMKDLSKADVIPESIVEAEKQKNKALADISEKVKEIKAKIRKKNPKYQD